MILGNIAGGKTWLSRKISQATGLPVFHVDSLQFLPSLEIRPLDETRMKIREILKQDSWILDGYGPLDLLDERLARADLVLFVDLPLWRHLWWLSKRQITILWTPRPELPKGSNELNLSHAKKLYRSLWKMHFHMRPQMLKLLNKPVYAMKVRYLRSKSEIKKVLQGDFRMN